MQDEATQMDDPRGSYGSSKTPLIAGLLLLLIAVAAAWFVFSRQMPGSPVKKVASMDAEAINQLKPFVDANKQLDELKKKAGEDLKKWAEANPEDARNPQKFQMKMEELDLGLQQKRNELLNPLQKKAEAAINLVAAEKKVNVVLDSHIVVFGVEDITEDVKKKFESLPDPKDIKLPPEPDTKTCPVAYFDQDVVRSLKAFQEAQMTLLRTKDELGQDIQAKLAKDPNMSAQEKGALQQEAALRLEARQEQIMAPLIQAVNESVKEVSQTESISLVLDKQHVMYGGRNITEEVVQAFLKKTGSKSEASDAKPADKPAAPSTP